MAVSAVTDVVQISIPTADEATYSLIKIFVEKTKCRLFVIHRYQYLFFGITLQINVSNFYRRILTPGHI